MTAFTGQGTSTPVTPGSSAFASTGEQVDIPLAAAQAAEGERYRKEDEAHIVRRICDLRETAEQQQAKRFRTTRRMRQLYHDQHDFTKKAPWQSKAWSPEMFSAMEKSVALFMAALTASERWFVIQDTWQRNAHREWVIEQLQQRTLERSGFYELVRPALLEGFLGGTIPLVVGVDSTADVPDVSLALWDPLDVYRDWTGRDRWVVLRSEVECYKLREWGEQGLYEQERVDAALETSKPSNSSLPDDKTPTCVVDVFYGDLSETADSTSDRGGGVMMRNAHAVVVNEEVLLRPLSPNPWRWGKAPVIFGHPLRMAFRVWPSGLAEHVSGLTRMVTEVLCSVLDDLAYQSMPVWQVDSNRVNKADLQRGLYPGKILSGDMSTGNPLVAPAVMGKVPVEAFNVVGLLSKKIMEATGATEHTSGNPGMAVGGRATATEVNRYLNQSLQIVNTMAKDLQVSCFEPLLDCMLSVFAQVTASDPQTWLGPDMAQSLGPDAALLMTFLDEETRCEVLTRGVRHKAKGISGTVTAREELQNLLLAVGSVQKDPAAYAMLKKRVVLEKVLALSRLDPEELMYTEEELAAQAAQQMQAMMAQRMVPPEGEAGAVRPTQRNHPPAGAPLSGGPGLVPSSPGPGPQNPMMAGV